MYKTGDKLRTGDWVVVNGRHEIAQTLDSEGTLDGLPFMPEMSVHCGRRFRVQRRAEKTCLEYPGRRYKMQEFKHNDVVILEMPRCTGTAHGDCQRACVLFWKAAWLTACESDELETPTHGCGKDQLDNLMKTTTAPGRYFCQSTQLREATQFFPRRRVVLKCFYDVLSGSYSLSEMTRMVASTLWRYATWWLRPPLRAGNLKRTPVCELNLQVGEWVTIKSEDQIVETLDGRALNRGLSCDRGMRQFCGGKYQVMGRLERMISETTGELLEVKNTVMLGGLKCICWHNHVGGCPREDLMYWREIWLNPVERIDDQLVTLAEPHQRSEPFAYSIQESKELELPDEVTKHGN